MPASLGPPDDAAVAGISEGEGRLWLAFQNRLMCLEGAHATSYPVPAGDLLDLRQDMAMGDGWLLLKPETDHLLRFDLKRRRFARIWPPAKTSFGMVGTRNPGLPLVQLQDAKGERLRIDSYDGRSLQKVIDVAAPFPVEYLKFIRGDRAGTIWVGGTSGLGRYESGKLDVIDGRRGYHADGGWAFAELPDGRIAIGSRDRLVAFDGHRWSVVLDGVDRVRSITGARDGTLWIASSSGVYRIRDSRIINHTKEEGLPSALATCVFEDRVGQIWAATARGFSIYHPEADRDPPRAILSDTDNLRETGPDGTMRLAFSGMDRWKYTPSDRLLFSYRLDQKDWSPFETSDRQHSVPLLPVITNSRCG